MTREFAPTSILAAVDFGDASAAAVALAGVLAERYGSALTVFHAETMEMPPYFTDDQIETLHAERLAARARATEYVRAFASRHTARPFEAVVGDGPPESAILRAAAGFGLVVLGTHGRRGASRWWLGSVAEAVVGGAAVPVVVTRVPAPGAIAGLRAGGASVLAGSDSPAVRGWAGSLAGVLSGSVVQIPEIRTCPADRIEAADIVVIGVPGPPGTFDDAVSGVLRTCQRPVMFVPETSGGGRTF